MSIPGITPGSLYATSQQPLSSISQHKHSSQQPQSLSDIDAQGSSVASPPSATGKVGSKLNITA
jgi:hypothetical protein